MNTNSMKLLITTLISTKLKENDLKRNYSLKNQVIHELKALNSLKDIGNYV